MRVWANFPTSFFSCDKSIFMSQDAFDGYLEGQTSLQPGGHIRHLIQGSIAHSNQFWKVRTNTASWRQRASFSLQPIIPRDSIGSHTRVPDVSSTSWSLLIPASLQPWSTRAYLGRLLLPVWSAHEERGEQNGGEHCWASFRPHSEFKARSYAESDAPAWEQLFVSGAVMEPRQCTLQGSTLPLS